MKYNPKDIIIFGKPGVGKDTLSNYIVKYYEYDQISTGKILRKMAEINDPLGLELKEKYWSKGNLVPDNSISNILKKYIDSLDNMKPILFNGFPRTFEQAQIFKSKFVKFIDYNPNLLIVWLIAPDEVLIKRMRSRGREDDTEEIIMNRLKIAESQIGNIISYFVRYTSILPILINADQEIGNVNRDFDEIMSNIGEV